MNIRLMAIAALVAIVAGCGGGDGKDGAPGAPGAPGGGGCTVSCGGTTTYAVTVANGNKEAPDGFTISAGSGVAVFSFDMDEMNGHALPKIRMVMGNDVNINGRIDASGPIYDPSDGHTYPSEAESVDSYTDGVNDFFEVLVRTYFSKGTAHPAKAFSRYPFVFSPEDMLAQHERAKSSAKSSDGSGEQFWYAHMQDGMTYHDIDLAQYGPHAYVEVQVNCPSSTTIDLWTRLKVMRIEILSPHSDGSTSRVDLGSATLLRCLAH